MPSKLSTYCDRVIEAGWLAALVIVPLFFNVYSSRVFEPDKLSVLRSIALVMIGAWLIKSIERGSLHDAETASDGGIAGAFQRWFRTPLVVPTLLLSGVYVLTTITSVVPRISLWGSYQRFQGTYTTLAYLTVFFMMISRKASMRVLT